jgi:hypothetical protein
MLLLYILLLCNVLYGLLGILSNYYQADCVSAREPSKTPLSGAFCFLVPASFLGIQVAPPQGIMAAGRMACDRIGRLIGSRHMAHGYDLQSRDLRTKLQAVAGGRNGRNFVNLEYQPERDSTGAGKRCKCG